MARIVECVPNFSEGRNKQIIDAIAAAASNTDGCTLLDVDPGPSTNRTVYTLVGSPEAVVEGALNMAKVAFKLIDMSKHHGEHPRFGALDVCPFIPVSPDITMDDCVMCAKQFGERLAKEINVPVYLYGFAAQEEKRKKLPTIRAGEYEKLADKLKDSEWKPDFGPSEFVPSWGATATGGRKFLIAYNVNVLGTKEQSHRIALDIREKGRGEGKPGKFKEVQAIGWWLEEANLAQVSINLTDMDQTLVHQVYEECKKQAEAINIAVCGSEIVGLVPLRALLEAAEYYIQKENLFILEEDQKIKLAVNRLGLSSMSPFKPEDRVIEYRVRQSDPKLLINHTLKDFILSVGARTSAPGGGSVAATVGALGAGLSTMVGWMTYGNRKFEALDSTMRRLLPPLHQAMNSLIPMIDADSEAFNKYMAAMRMPKETEEQQKIRAECMDTAMKNAVMVPMTVAQTVNTCWTPLKEMAVHGNINCKSDLQVGARSLELGVWGAYYNVMINLPSVEDAEFKEKAKAEAEGLLKQAQDACVEVLKIIGERA
ncbi:formimidoyltransferase-cyclodeaminase-like [Amphiura filiformis]|uniref:formimidoyltransferase-cyclodeaminase-like n=1 Tax=Amphiura filiformis TaxID=82378 RepID=UPI003B22074B